MRALVLIPFLLLGACGGGDAAAEVEFTKVEGRVVGVKASCEIVPPGDGKSEPVALQTGDCNDILPESRKLENRGNTAQRVLEITFVYTSPADQQLQQITSEVRRPVSAAVPRPGDTIEVMAHPQDPSVATLS